MPPQNIMFDAVIVTVSGSDTVFVYIETPEEFLQHIGDEGHEPLIEFVATDFDTEEEFDERERINAVGHYFYL